MRKLIALGLMCLSMLNGYAQDNNKKYKPEITCTEVCGVRFGCSYETAKEILKQKYGDPDYFGTDENTILYKYKVYAGMNFAYIAFCFQREGTCSFMNQCVMGDDCKTVEEAKNKRDAIWEKVKAKYPFCHNGIDCNGFRFYESGCSPLGGFGNGFIVDVVKYDVPINGYKYFARIMYGPYNYVQEDF